MRKRMKIIVLLIIGCTILVLGASVILYAIKNCGNKYSADNYYVSPRSEKESMEVIVQIVDRNIKEPTWKQSIKIVKPKDDNGPTAIIQPEEDIDVIVEAEQIIQEQISEENAVELIDIKEVVDEEIATDVDSSNNEMIEYTGDKNIDNAINVYREEISDEDIVFGLSILEKIDSDVVYSFFEDGLTDVEKDQLSKYLHNVLTVEEYAKAKELFSKYSYILD